ncbi:la-related protein 1C [Lactuca sativa]|nr:la-related protein 1C [Lactuca sativa]
MDSSRRGNNGGQRPSGNREWNQHTRFNNMHRQRGFRRGFVNRSTSPHVSNSFMPPQMHVPIPPFGNNFMYPDLASYVQGSTPPSLITPMQSALSFPVQDQDLHEKIVKQIDYYFSDENLVKDLYLRQKMDEQGWVHVNLIASFKKVLCLTDNVKLILDVMRASRCVEVRGEKMRKRNDWMRWIIPSSINVESFYGNSVSSLAAMIFRGQPWLKEYLDDELCGI